MPGVRFCIFFVELLKSVQEMALLTALHEMQASVFGRKSDYLT